MTGYWTPVHLQPSHVRQSILQSWATSRFEALRFLAKTIGSLAHKAVAVASPVFHRTVGYTDAPPGWRRIEDAYPFRFIQIPGADSHDHVHTITTDVVIIGSGCGGSVAAKTIAEAGHRVLVADKAYYFPPSHLPMPQIQGLHNLFDNGGMYTTTTGASVLSGSAWGGGGAVNWSVCLRPQDFVRREWAESTGLAFFEGEGFDASLDRVWDFVGAGVEGLQHNHGNKVMLDGSRRLGFRVAEAAHNTGGRAHECGRCHLGCGSAVKRGPAVSWLPAAGEAGAEFMEGFKADKVLFDESGERAVGVEGVWTSRPSVDQNGSDEESRRVKRRVRIMASKVIVSAGALRSPLLLKDSGIEVRSFSCLPPLSTRLYGELRV